MTDTELWLMDRMEKEVTGIVQSLPELLPDPRIVVAIIICIIAILILCMQYEETTA